jgi:DsbC/DsbD-like thiol-disulfide interchange protein
MGKEVEIDGNPRSVKAKLRKEGAVGFLSYYFVIHSHRQIRRLPLMRLLTVIFGFLLVHTAKAEMEALRVELISDAATVVPGQIFFVGLHLQHPEGTHTYWKFPGIVGLATRIEWSPPEGVKVGEIQWPAPQKVMMAKYETQGYEGETLLMCPVILPPGFQAKTLTLNAKVSWMHCGKTCHPATDQPFSISLPVGDVAEANASHELLFKKFHSKIPTASTEWKTISVERKADKIILTLEPVLRIRDPFWNDHPPVRFFTSDGQVDSDQDQEIQVSLEGVIVMTLAASSTGPKNPKTLPGVIEIPTGKAPRYIEINPVYLTGLATP